METRKNERNERRQRSGKDGVVTLAPDPSQSLLGKLWNEEFLAAPGGALNINLDTDLTRATWTREPGNDEHAYYAKWKSLVTEYFSRYRQLRGHLDDGAILEDDPFWEQWRELVDEYRNKLFSSHNEWERVFRPQVQLSG